MVALERALLAFIGKYKYRGYKLEQRAVAVVALGILLSSEYELGTST